MIEVKFNYNNKEYSVLVGEAYLKIRPELAIRHAIIDALLRVEFDNLVDNIKRRFGE